MPKVNMGKRWAVISTAFLLFSGLLATGCGSRATIGLKLPDAVRVDDSTYCFHDLTAMMHLLIGKDAALVIDTGFGLVDLKGAVDRLTTLPLKVVNTHGHFDHTHGNWQFGGSMVSYKDLETITRHDNPDYLFESFFRGFLYRVLLRKATIEKICHQPKSQYTPLPEDMTIDLGGGRLIRIFEIPGHTPGSIALLDVKYHRLYTGDMFCSGDVLLNLPESMDIQLYLQSVRFAKKICSENGVKEIFPSHPECPLPVSILDDFETASLIYLENQSNGKDTKGRSVSYGKARLKLK